MTAQAAAREPHPILHAFGIHSFARGVAMLLATTTMLMALFTFLNVKADGNSKRFDATAQKGFIEALTLETNGKTQVSFDWGTAYRTWKELDTAARSAELARDVPETERLKEQRNAVRSESKLLSDRYFPKSDGAPGTAQPPDLALYETELYFLREQRLSEEASNLADIKSFWDGQVNRYITVLAFLSAALFIAGLALTVPRRVAGLLVGLSIVMIIGGSLYGANAYRNTEPRIPAAALDAYAEGQAAFHLAASAGDSDRRLADYDMAISKYRDALFFHPTYTNALTARAEAYVDKGLLQFQRFEEPAIQSFKAAVSDYKDAQSQGLDDASSNWNLGWVYYLMGDFDNAIAADQRALQQDPSLFGVRSNLGLAYLASNRYDEAEREITKASDDAAQSIIAALVAKQEPPASAWTLLEAIGIDLDNLWMRANGKSLPFNEAPSPKAMRELDRVSAKAAELRDRAANLTVSLEETGKLPPTTPPAAKATFTAVNSLGTRTSTGAVRGPDLPYQTTGVEVQFRYEGMRQGQKVVWRVFRDGQQDRLLGRHRTWDLGTSGTASFSMSYAYSTLYQFAPGYYVLELFIDQQVVGRTNFTVLEPD
jgi:tetratricopeptide (TPR) repeat protein